MEINEIQESEFVTLKPVGDLDANSSIELDIHIRRLLDAGQINLLIDCAGVPYMSSAGLGVFVSYLDEFKDQKGKLVLSNLTPNVAEVFDLLGLSKLVTIINSKEEVANFFKG
ncbi:MAG: STAS domain-containing protein [Bacteroidota bacterium]